MKNHTKHLKIYLAPLLIIFLFSKLKAEPYGLAFTNFSSANQKDSLKINLSEKQYYKAKNLFTEGNYSKSLELAYSLLEDKDEVIQIKTNLLLGKIFEKNNSIEPALNYFKKSLDLLNNRQIKIKDLKNIDTGMEVIKAESLIKLGKLYVKIQESNKAMFYLRKLVDIQSADDEILLMKGNAYNNLSVIMLGEKKYKEAKSYLLQAINFLEKVKNKDDLAMVYQNLAGVYEIEEEREKALKTYFKALSYMEFEKDVKSLENKEVLYYNIAWTMYNLKDYKAYEYLEKSYDLKDSLINVGLRKELKKIERTHNIDLIRKEAESKRAQLIKNNWFIGIVGALISLLFLYLANLNKLKQKNLRIQLTEKELEQRKKLEKLKSDSQVKIINATIDGKETERKVIAETLHDNVSALLSSANMHLQATQKQFGGKAPIELQKTQQIIAEASLKIRDLSHNLVSSILLKFGLEYAVKDAAKKYSNSTIQIHTAITNVGRYEQEFEIKVYNIIQEFINNILKHSKATTAYVVMEEEEENLLIIVKDNGCGFQLQTAESNGIGLNQIEARVDVMLGEFSVESSIGVGTKVMINIPVVRKRKRKS